MSGIGRACPSGNTSITNQATAAAAAASLRSGRSSFGGDFAIGMTTDDRPTLFEIDGRDLASYVARHKADEFYIYAMDAGSNDGISRKHAHYTLHVRYPSPTQGELIKT